MSHCGEQNNNNNNTTTTTTTTNTTATTTKNYNNDTNNGKCLTVQAHYSLKKAGLFLGIGMNNVIPIATDNAGHIVASALDQQMQKDKAEVWAVVSVFCFVLLSSSISGLRLLAILSCVNLALYRQKARVCVCVCVCVCVSACVSA